MRIVLLFLLLSFAGCGSRDTIKVSGNTNASKETSKNLADALTIVPVPRPNSGEFTTEQATKLLPQFLERSVSVLATDKAVVEWKSPTQGIRIHVKADDTVEIVDYWGEKSLGIDFINAALDSTMTYGNERSVLLTSNEIGWKNPVKQKVVALLLQPSVQIYIIECAKQ